MKTSLLILIASCWWLGGSLYAQSFQVDVAPLIESSCIDCHDAETETNLNFEQLGYDLTDPDAFRLWDLL